MKLSPAASCTLTAAYLAETEDVPARSRRKALEGQLPIRDEADARGAGIGELSTLLDGHAATLKTGASAGYIWGEPIS